MVVLIIVFTDAAVVVFGPGSWHELNEANNYRGGLFLSILFFESLMIHFVVLIVSDELGLNQLDGTLSHARTNDEV